MVEANESGMSQWLGGKEEGKDGLIGMEAREGARGGKSQAPSSSMPPSCGFRCPDVPQVSEPSP